MNKRIQRVNRAKKTTSKGRRNSKVEAVSETKQITNTSTPLLQKVLKSFGGLFVLSRFGFLVLLVILSLYTLYLISGRITTIESSVQEDISSYMVLDLSDERFLGSIKTGTIDEIKYILSMGVNVHATDEMNRNAIILAAMLDRNPDIIDLLVKYGVEINQQDINGYNALMLNIMIAGRSEDYVIARRLIKHGIDINAKTNSGISALIVGAGLSNKYEILELLLENGAIVDATNQYGQSALMVAANITTEPAIIATLLRHNADPDMTDDFGMSANRLIFFNNYLKDDPEINRLLTSN